MVARTKELPDGVLEQFLLQQFSLLATLVSVSVAASVVRYSSADAPGRKGSAPGGGSSLFVQQPGSVVRRMAAQRELDCSALPTGLCRDGALLSTSITSCRFLSFDTKNNWVSALFLDSDWQCLHLFRTNDKQSVRRRDLPPLLSTLLTSVHDQEPTALRAPPVGILF